MKRLVVACVAVVLLGACQGNKAGSGEEPLPVDAVVAADTVVADADSDLLADVPMPKAADELFDDFFFNFAASEKLQRERILFPLKRTNGDKVETISREEWKMERYFMRQDFYTLLFDSERQMEVVKDTSIRHAVVETIYFNTGAIIQHVFDRLRGAWMLTAVNTVPIRQSGHASFLEFYHRFATDSLFQAESLMSTIHFVGPDPDDDFSQMEGEITPDTWEAFAPELPDRKIYNIVYGQPQHEGNTMIFVLRGIANGMEMELTFKRVGNSWKLQKMTT